MLDSARQTPQGNWEVFQRLVVATALIGQRVPVFAPLLALLENRRAGVRRPADGEGPTQT